MLNLNRSSVSIEDIEAHRPANNWATGFLNNLRVARMTYAGAEVHREIADLARHAEETAEKLLDETSKGRFPPGSLDHGVLIRGVCLLACVSASPSVIDAPKLFECPEHAG